jgi:hypothetical protein
MKAGELRPAAFADPPSPEYDGEPFPAMVLIIPVDGTI